nr:tetratricopeptide repeat protein [Hassalia byssoidea]
MALGYLRRSQESIDSIDDIALKIKRDKDKTRRDRDIDIACGYLERYRKAINSNSYNKALEFNRDDYTVWIIRGDAFGYLWRKEEAIVSYDKAIEIKPDSHKAWHHRGIALSSFNRYEEAIVSYDKAIEIKPNSHEAWYNRGIALRYSGRSEEAIVSYDKAIEIKPDYYKAWDNRSEILFYSGRYEEAIASYDKTIEIKADSHKAWYHRGIALSSFNRYEEAIASYDKALEIKPNDYLVWKFRGEQFSKLRRYEEAIASYDKALKIKPNSHETWYNRGIAAFKADSRAPRLIFGSTIATKNPHLNQRGYEGALASYKEGLKYWHDQDSSLSLLFPREKLHQAIGNAHYLQGKVSSHPHSYWYEAVNSYNKALKTFTQENYSESHLDVVQDLIRVLWDLEDTTEAKKWKRHGLEAFTKLFNSKETFSERQQLAFDFISFSQMRVDVLVEESEPVLALEAAERNKNSYLTWILDAQKQNVLSPNYADMQQLTDHTTAIVYWHLSPFALTTFVIKPNTAQPSVIPTPFPLGDIESWVKQWNQQYEESRKSKDKQLEQQNNWRGNLPDMLNRLGAFLNISGILSEIDDESIQNLILIPHRDLHRFPLHALFPDYFTTTYLPSAQIGIFVQQIESTNNGEVHQLLSVEHPNSTGFDVLPHTEIESAAINKLFNHANNQRISGEEATNATVKEALATQYGIFHFTGHGSYDFEHPKQSALVLSGEDKLTVEEICDIQQIAEK